MSIRKTATKFLGCLGLLLALAPSGASAHSNEYLATIKGAHGGWVRMAELYHFELVVKPGEASVWVTDHGDAPQSTRGADASLRLVTGSQAVTLKLTPGRANELLVKDGRIKLVKGATRAILTVTMPGQKPLQTRYTLDEIKPAAAQSGTHDHHDHGGHEHHH